MRKLIFVSVLLAVISCGNSYKKVIKSLDLEKGLYAELMTSKGNIYIKLEPELAPVTTANFVGLAEGSIENTIKKLGEPFFDGLTFHRVVPGFVIQGGDPLGNGAGGPGYRFGTEVSPKLKHYKEGTVAMANSGVNTNGSQFYITMGATEHLDGAYNVFGYVIKGMDVVKSITVGDKIEKVNIIRVGKTAKKFDAASQMIKLP
ncbi:MAG: peptidylprolyl isomerase [Flavobacteriales bacterium]|nr:peptidylprolyl isomerase [Flavobacteriales bacterium]